MKALQIILLFTSCFVFSQNSVYPYLDSDLDVTKRVEDLMSRMTLYEKACQMNHGLAQVKGFRGEIETNDDIINRVKFDIYYLENWSLILDLNIVFLTAINFLTGHKKAY